MTERAPVPADAPDRSLVAIGAGILVLVVVAVAAVVLLGSRGAVDLPADSPEGVVQRHLAAHEKGDHEEAWGYFSADVQEEMPLDTYRRTAGEFGAYRDFGSRRILFDESEVDGDRARVHLTVEEFYDGGPFGGGETFRSGRVIDLVREDGAWRIDDALIGLEPAPFEFDER